MATHNGGKIRFGMVGCGEIAMRSLEAIQSQSEVCEVGAVFDVVDKLSSDAGEKAGTPHFTDYEKFLADAPIDAVVISTPHFLHKPLTIQAAKAGKHVACEKPIATNLADCDEMIAACKTAKVKLNINYISRYDNMTRKTRELVQAGVIGDIIRYQVQIMADKPETYWQGGYTGRNKSDWRTSKEKSGGGVLVMNLSHDLDRVLWSTGLVPVRVSAEMATHCTPGVEVEDNISAVVRFENGAIGAIDAMSCARGREDFGNRLYGTHGQIDMNRPLRAFTTKEGIEGLKPNEWTEIPVDGSRWGNEQRERYFADFARDILEDRTPLICGEEARKALALCEAIYQSAETHEPAKVG